MVKITLYTIPELCNVAQKSAQFETQTKLDLSLVQYTELLLSATYQYDKFFKPKANCKLASKQRQIYGRDLHAYDHELAHECDDDEFSTGQSFDIDLDVYLIKAFKTEARVARNETQPQLSNEQ